VFLVLCLRNPGEGGVVVVAALVFQGMIVCVSNKPQLHVFLFVKNMWLHYAAARQGIGSWLVVFG